MNNRVIRPQTRRYQETASSYTRTSGQPKKGKGEFDLFHGWVGKGLRVIVKMISSISYVLGVIVLMLGDIFLGSQVLPGMFTAASGTWEKSVLPWLIAAGTSAAQMGAWALVFKFQRGLRGLPKAVTLAIGGGVAIAISLVDTFIDALYAQKLVFGSSPTVFPIPELATFGGGVHFGFWILIFLFGLISLAGEPVALFMLFAADAEEEVAEGEDEAEEREEDLVGSSSVPVSAG